PPHPSQSHARSSPYSPTQNSNRRAGRAPNRIRSSPPAKIHAAAPAPAAISAQTRRLPPPDQPTPSATSHTASPQTRSCPHRSPAISTSSAASYPASDWFHPPHPRADLPLSPTKNSP